jgi:DMSO/TMAO reductase YedYZ molybdopterin-dependent catalytic subunit
MYLGYIRFGGRSDRYCISKTGEILDKNDGDIPFSGMIVREKDPTNLEFPFAALETFITPTERFYVRSHFPTPQFDRNTWRLRVDGCVNKPLELTLDDVIGLPSKSVTTTMECAGNSRIYLPKAKGVQWELGAASNAEWRGVGLADVLRAAGLKNEAVDVVMEGADRGEIKDEPKPKGPIAYSRSLPIDKAMNGDVLLAYEMNGEPLSPAHGYPLRVIVPGWYGMASVKWLSRISVLDHTFNGYWQTIDYTYWDRNGGEPVMKPISDMLVKSEIARPSINQRIVPDSVYPIFGAAWTGSDALIDKVDISTNGGKDWSAARLLQKPQPYAWVLWQYDWHVPATAGTYTLMSRATDSRGETQPEQHNKDRGGYMINFILPITVDVR